MASLLFKRESIKASENRPDFLTFLNKVEGFLGSIVIGDETLALYQISRQQSMERWNFKYLTEKKFGPKNGYRLLRPKGLSIGRVSFTRL